MFRTLLLNLPNAAVITRRYMCSYYSPVSLFPPYELLSLGGIVRSWKNQPVDLIDAIAERIDRADVFRRIRALQPNLIVTIAGFECFAEDMEEVEALKREFPTIPLVLFGHYPTLFADEVMAHTPTDYILLGEPDLNFSELFDALATGGPVGAVPGVVSRDGAALRVTGTASRIGSIEELPMPAFELLPVDRYSEPAMPRPFGMIQSARGCPYACNYCVRSYGKRLTAKSPEKVFEEFDFLVSTQGIRSLRFIDDTFTVNRKRVLTICEMFRQRNTGVEWACLSRTDNLDAELLRAMKAAGCRRIYFGIESGSQRILDLYDKRIDREQALEVLRLCHDVGVETSGFFMVGLPFETEADFAETVAFARAAKLTYASIAPLTLYPGTQLFDLHKDVLDFSLFPYTNEFRDQSWNSRWAKWEKTFYRNFYFRPSYVTQNWRPLLRAPASILRHGGNMLRFLSVPGSANALNNLGDRVVATESPPSP